MGQSSSTEKECSTETKEKEPPTPSFTEALQSRAVAAQISLTAQLESMLDAELSPEIVSAHVESTVTDLVKRVSDVASNGQRHIPFIVIPSTLFETVCRRAKEYSTFDNCTYNRRFLQFIQAVRSEFAARTQMIFVEDLLSVRISHKPVFYLSHQGCNDHKFWFSVKF